MDKVSTTCALCDNPTAYIYEDGEGLCLACDEQVTKVIREGKR